MSELEHKETKNAHSVNFTMSFGCNVLPEDINKQRKWLEKGEEESIWDIIINKDSTDEEIANYLALENYRDFFLTEAVEMEMEDHHVYDEKDTERIRKNYEDRVKHFREANRPKFEDVVAKACKVMKEEGRWADGGEIELKDGTKFTYKIQEKSK